MALSRAAILNNENLVTIQFHHLLPTVQNACVPTDNEYKVHTYIHGGYVNFREEMNVVSFPLST